MSETKVNSSLFNKFKRTKVNSVQNLPDIRGLTIDEFHVDSRLDIVSGEADIYLCSQVNDNSGKSLLLKYYRRENAVKPDVIEKLKTVNSPCVAPIEGYGEYDGHQYVVRPYYEMSALSELLAEGTRFSEEDLKNLIVPSIIAGLKAVHDVGILHKDLKPANLIPDDTGEHIVLIDFGISSDAGKNTFVVTQTGMTPFYAAPEAMQGIFHKETDYYALGITIFELFTGFTPFQNPGITGEQAARLASISKIEFPADFPENLKKLVLGLTYKDISHRNEKDNPNRRWGYDEVSMWLKGDDVPVPGKGKEAFRDSTFLPYSFDGISYTNVQDLVIAMLKNPAAGIRELGRGILAHHFGLFDGNAAKLCHDAEKKIQNTDDAVQIRSVFYRLMYSLAPGLTGLYCKGREFHDLKDLGYEAFNAALFQDHEFCKELTLLQKSFLEYYASTIIKSPVASGISKNTGEIISHNKYTEEQTAWIVGYAFSEKRGIRVHGDTFNDVDGLREHIKKLEIEKSFKDYVKYIEESQHDLKFFATCYPDRQDRLYFSEILEVLDRAVFGNGELQFRNARDFDNYVGKLRKEKRINRLLTLQRKYGAALKEVSENVWKDSSCENLNYIVSGFIKSEERRPESDSFGSECHGSISIKGIKYPLPKPVRKGDYIKFGSYRMQDKNTGTPIEWLILDVFGNEALLISRYAVECKPYHHSYDSVTWENCDLRKWLNNDFLNTAFSKEEIERIKVSDLRNDGNRRYCMHSGNSTRDRVFCLSITEVERYFEADTGRQCQPTVYTKKQGAYVDVCNGCCWWWLRSPGTAGQDFASCVNADGVLIIYGNLVDNGSNAVRPALWVNL